MLKRFGEGFFVVQALINLGLVIIVVGRRRIISRERKIV